MSGDSPLIGRSFGQLNLSLRYGVTVVSVLRGSHRVNAPHAETVFMPADRISVVGTDEQLQQFARAVEVPLSPVDREDVTMYQFSVGERSVLIGMTVAQFGMMTRGSCLIIGIDRSDGTYVRPLSLVRFRPYDMVWVAGDKESIDRVIAGAGEHGPKTVRKEAPEHSPRERS